MHELGILSAMVKTIETVAKQEQLQRIEVGRSVRNAFRICSVFSSPYSFLHFLTIHSGME